MTTAVDTDFVIVGAGAAGLMAAVVAGEAGLRCVVLERRHRPGLKLLLCGNNRCNISHDYPSAEQMLADYGEPVASFLRTAMNAFPPAVLRRWFAQAGLATCVKGTRIYPVTEKADDVLHCFMDRLRDLSVPLMLNCPVERIIPLENGDGYRLTCKNLTLTARCVLLATGGVSYPKTGSVGDGQRMLADLGVDVTPLRAGLAGIDAPMPLAQVSRAEVPDVQITLTQHDRVIGKTAGNFLLENGVIRGKAVLDATRLIARQQATDVQWQVDFCPSMSVQTVMSRLTNMRNGMNIGVPPEILSALQSTMPSGKRDARAFAEMVKRYALGVASIRPLKEAIVTVGGVALAEVDPQTMGVRNYPGLFVAGELLDVDGPTGGYNLHASFATARCAVAAVCKRCGVKTTFSRPSVPYSQPVRGEMRPSSARWEKEVPKRRRSRADSRPGNRW